MTTGLRGIALMLGLVVVTETISSHAQDNKQIMVVVSTPTPSVGLGSAIRVDVKLINAVDHPVRLLRYPGTDWPDGHAEVASIVDVVYQEGNHLHPFCCKILSRRTTWLAPAAASENYLILTDLFHLEKPGHYTISLREELLEIAPSGERMRRTLVPSNLLSILVSP